MENYPVTIRFKSAREINFRWPVNSYTRHAIELDWRSIAIRCEFKDTSVVTITALGKKWNFGFKCTKFGRMDGSSPKPIKIEFDKWKLNFKMDLNQVTLIDTLKEDMDKNYQEINFENPFNNIREVEPEQPTREELEATELKNIIARINKKEITLFSENTVKYNFNSKAYFVEDRLFVDRWLLTDNYEDENYIIISDHPLEELYSLLNVDASNRSEVLLVLSNMFHGENCFNKFERFLVLSKIKYQKQRRDDCR